VSLAGATLVGGTCALAGEAEHPAMRLALLGLASSLLMAAVAFLLALRSPLGAGPALGWRRGGTRLGPLRVALLTVGSIGASHLLDTGIQALDLREASVLAEFDRVLRGVRGLPLVVLIVGVGIAPGLGEELLFRGLLLRGFTRRFGVAMGLATSSLLFGALHLDPVQGAAAALLGLYLGCVAIAAGGTRTAVLCHVSNNLSAVAAAAYSGATAPPAIGPVGGAMLLGAGLALLAGVAVLARALPEGIARFRISTGLRTAAGMEASGEAARAPSVRGGDVVGELVPAVKRDPEQGAPEQE